VEAMIVLVNIPVLVENVLSEFAKVSTLIIVLNRLLVRVV
jgi:hypothetical protein